MKDHLDMRQLFDKYVNNTCTPEEAVQLMRILQSGQGRDAVERLIEAHMQAHPDVLADDIILNRVFKKLMLNDQPRGKPHKSARFPIMAAAAVLLIAILTGTSIYFQYQERVSPITQHDVSPGGNRATLTLADGRTINLHTDQSGIVVGDEILYTDGSPVIEREGNEGSWEREQSQYQALTSSNVYTLTTPKGGTYQITLPDGTKVWLNAASTLRYPSHFDAHERVVELEGEAYFEVSKQVSSGPSKPAHSQEIPFRVVSNGQTVEVLGTHFNINAYPDESTTKTTLLEGAVRIVVANHSTLLKPGQQSKVNTNRLSVANVDTETVIDWKNGDFIFADETLENIMRKIARWYNVKVIYEGQLSSDRYNAQISRNKNLSQVLHILELSGGLTFRITDNVLFLSPPN